MKSPIKLLRHMILTWYIYLLKMIWKQVLHSSVFSEHWTSSVREPKGPFCQFKHTIHLYSIECFQRKVNACWVHTISHWDSYLINIPLLYSHNLSKKILEGIKTLFALYTLFCKIKTTKYVCSFNSPSSLLLLLELLLLLLSSSLIASLALFAFFFIFFFLSVNTKNIHKCHSISNFIKCN